MVVVVWYIGSGKMVAAGLKDSTVAEIQDQEIAYSSFCRYLRKWRFRFEERREGVAAAR
jgi:hypothetical protein